MEKLNRSGKIYLIRIMFASVLQGIILFSCAGRFDYIRGWIFVVLTLIYSAITNTILAVKKPEIVNARGERKKDTKLFDKIILPFYMIMMYAVVFTAGFDAGRFRRAVLPFYLLYPGLAILIFSSVLVNLAIHGSTEK